MIPDIEIFKEVMVELIKSREIDIPALKRERSEFIQESSGGFQLHEMLLYLLEEQEAAGAKVIEKIEICRTEGTEPVVFEEVNDAYGTAKTIRCSDLRFLAHFE